MTRKEARALAYRFVAGVATDALEAGAMEISAPDGDETTMDFLLEAHSVDLETSAEKIRDEVLTLIGQLERKAAQ